MLLIIKNDPIAPMTIPNPTPTPRIENLCKPTLSGFLRVARNITPKTAIAMKPHVSIFTSEELLTNPFYRIAGELQEGEHD